MFYKSNYLKYIDKYETLHKQIGGNYKQYTEYKAAGMMFTDTKHILAGYQKTGFSGIGGGRELVFDRNDAKLTAIREILEELYGIEMIKLSNNIQQAQVNEDPAVNLDKFQQMLVICNTIVTNDTFITDEIKKQINNYTKRTDIMNNNNKILGLILDINETLKITSFAYYRENFYINFICTFNDIKIISDAIKRHNLTSKYYPDLPNNIYELISMRKKVGGEIGELTLFPIQTNLSIDKYFISDIGKLIDKKDEYSM